MTSHDIEVEGLEILLESRMRTIKFRVLANLNERGKRCFLVKKIRNAVLQWKRWFLSIKTLILPRKRSFLVTKKWKCRFTVEKMVFISKNINFTSKTNFFTEKILEMPFYSGRDGFYQ